MSNSRLEFKKFSAAIKLEVDGKELECYLCGTRRQKWKKHELLDRIGGRQGDGGIQELILPILDTLDTFSFGRRASRISQKRNSRLL